MFLRWRLPLRSSLCQTLGPQVQSYISPFFVDFDYYFPKKSPEYAVFLHDLPLEQDLTAFTACAWIKTNYIGTIFSYTAVQDDDIVMNVTPNVVFLWILSERR